MLLRHPFFRSYGVSLPSSLTKVISRALAYSARLPVSDCGTVAMETPHEVFLGSVVGPLPAVTRSSLGFQFNDPPDFPGESPYGLSPGQPLPGRFTLLRHPLSYDASIAVPEY